MRSQHLSANDSAAAMCGATKIAQILRTSAGPHWSVARRQLRLLLLEFRDSQLEVEWKEAINSLLKHSTPLVGIVTVLVFAQAYIIVLLGRYYRWFGNVQQAVVRPAEMVATIIGIACGMLVVSAPRIRFTRNHLEIVLTSALLIQILCVAVWSWTSMALKSDNEGSAYISLVNALLKVISGITVAFTTFFMSTRIRYLIPLFLLTFNTLAGNLGFRIAWSDSRRQHSFCGVEICAWALIHLLSFGARWFNELHNRCLKIVVVETQTRVREMRSRKRQDRRRATTTAKEQVVDHLYETMALIQEAHDDPQRCSDDLDTAAAEIRSIIRDLTEGGDLLASSADRSGEGAEFMELYQVTRPNSGGDRVAVERLVPRLNRRTSELDALLKSSPSPLLKKSTYVPPQPTLRASETHIIGRDPFFNVSVLLSQVQNPIMEIGIEILKPQLSFLDLNELVALAFLHVVSVNVCRENPYHNPMYVAGVLHMSIALLQALSLDIVLTPLERLAYTLSAIAMHLGHSGRDAQFYTRSNNLLATVMSDISVTQHWSALLMVRILGFCSDTNLLSNLSTLEQSEFRSLFFPWVLSSDYARHFEVLAESRVLRMSPDFDPQLNIAHRKQMCLLTLKTANEGFYCVDWESSLDWEMRRVCERYLQGDEERSMGLIVAPLCARSDHQRLAPACLDYHKYVVMPLVTELSQWDFTDFIQSHVLPRCAQNRGRWMELSVANDILPLPEWFAEAKLPPSTISIIFAARLFSASAIEHAFEDIDMS